MSYNLKDVNGYGTGALGDIVNPTGQLCSYANVVSVSEIAVVVNSISIGVASEGIYEKFVVGSEILVHISGCLSGTTAEYLGKYMVCKITAVADSSLVTGGKILTIDKNITDIIPMDKYPAHILQVITIPQFNKLTVNTSISPIAYNATNKYGGILPIKCKSELIITGSINLVDKGIPVANKALRYWTKQECADYNAVVTTTTKGNGLLDTDLYSAWENHITVRQLLLNAGDGVCAIWTHKITNTGSSTNTRIGNTYAGLQFCRGANDSKTYNSATNAIEEKTAGITNIGGSTIMLVADDIDGFMPSMISKYRDSTKPIGQGLGRCYIALKDSVLRNDEGLYAFDTVSDIGRLVRELNIKNYGSGRHGEVTLSTRSEVKIVNNFAKIVAIGGGGKSITYDYLTSKGIADFSAGAMVMFHISKHLDSTDMNLLGKFIIAKVISHDTVNKIIYLDTNILKLIPFDKFSKYNCQLISVLESTQCNKNAGYYCPTVGSTPWDDTNKIGGIIAIACTDTYYYNPESCCCSSGGGGTAYGREGLAFIGHAQMRNRLPIGQGLGSLFLLANNINTVRSRDEDIIYPIINNVYAHYNRSQLVQCGYASPDVTIGNLHTPGGSGAGGLDKAGYGGENGFSSATLDRFAPPFAGAHLFIIANKINFFAIEIFNTGGTNPSSIGAVKGSGHGGDAYAGVDGRVASGGGYISGGGCSSNTKTDGAYRYSVTGSSSGWCFIYCNEVTDIDKTGVTI